MVRISTLKHGNAMLAKDLLSLKKIKEIYSPRHAKKLELGVTQIITETDGSMIPVVKVSTSAKDKRKKKERVYQEARLCMSYQDGSMTPIYAATMLDVNTTGKYMRLTALEAGLGRNSNVHSVGDGATWIFKQLRDKFGDVTKVDYLIDLYHMSEYLSATSLELKDNEKKQKMWVRKQIKLLKNNESLKVLDNIRPYVNHNLENATNDCYRYINNRPNQFNYKRALAEKLPIGSGRVEGGHRHVIQARLKISGAAWTPQNANVMLALRTNRTNDKWDTYWKCD